MSQPLSPLEPRVLELLRKVPRPGPGARDRVRARLFAGIPGPGGGGPASEGGSSKAEGSSRLGRGSLAGIALLMGGAGGALLHASWSQPPRLTAVAQLDRSAAAASHAVDGLGAPTPETSVVEPFASSFRPDERPRPHALSDHPSAAVDTGSTSTGPSQLAAERALLDEARTALVHGDPERALERLRKHQQTFLNPMLSEEREAMVIEALVRAGHSADARVRAAAFRRRSPNSLFLPTVQSVIALIP